jgi:lipopolysaccharide transport system permease protein
MPISSHIFVTLFKNIIIFFHNFIIIIIILVFFGNININLIYFLPGFFLLTIILFFITLTVSILCARFRDLMPIIISINQILFFLTPVWWSEKLLTNSKELLILNFNPFNHFIAIVREPLLGTQINFFTIIFIFLLLLVLTPFSLYLFSKTYKKIVFWI